MIDDGAAVFARQPAGDEQKDAPRALASNFLLHSLDVPTARRFTAYAQIQDKWAPRAVVVLNGSRFAGSRFRPDDFLAAGFGYESLTFRVDHIEVTRDVLVPTSRDGLFGVLGVLGAHWKTAAGASLHHVLSYGLWAG